MTNIEICEHAKKKIDTGAWNYLVGGAEDELSLRRNRKIFQKWNFVPHVLRDVNALDLTTTFLRTELRLPIIAAPVGGLTQFHAQGEYEWARGLSASDIAGTVSGVARVEFEKIILETKSPLYYQLYFFGDDHWVEDQLKRAEACGYQAVVVTVDTPYYSRRERDLRADYDARTAGWRTAAQPPDSSRNPTLDWRKLEKIRGYTKLPLIIKGISAPADVKQAGKEKIDGVWISNHGGRCTDNSLSALESLVRLRPLLKNSSLEVIYDGGVRRGSEVLTALLLGADVVALGRLPVYGLIWDGAEGMKEVFENLEAELRCAMGLLGLTRLQFKGKGMDQYIVENPAAVVLDTVWDQVEG
jgi:isopentenyl diphosphate isomerase/L-lactate dehydrogenase-like FMN-dependent dehydrogenase